MLLTLRSPTAKSTCAIVCVPLVLVVGLVQHLAADDNPVFRSDVALVRVDASVVDRDNRAITGLRAEDFVLRESGRTLQIRNFASENMPIDVLLLLDVSGSMRPHVQRIADAAHQALRVLRDDDRIGIMVFDRYTRLRLPLRSNRKDVEREFESLLRQETFRGGTDITRALYEAAEYIGHNGRREARRAIVILTDDETGANRDEDGVSRALTRADAVLSALIAPDAMRYRSGMPGGGQRGPQNGGTWPGSNGPLGGVILGRPRGPYGGPGGGPQAGGGQTHSAGTAEIARRSGGDSMPVDGAYALEDTLARIRQRYAMYFYLPAGVRSGEQRSVSVELSEAALRRHPYAEVRYRHEYYVPSGITPTQAPPEGTVISRAPVSDSGDRQAARPARRPGVSQADGLPDQPILKSPDPVEPASSSAGNAPASNASGNAPPASNSGASDPKNPPASQQPASGRWRRVAPGEQQ